MNYTLYTTTASHIVESDTINGLYAGVISKFKHTSIERNNTLELQNTQLVLTNPRNRRLTLSCRNLPMVTQIAEFAWYMLHTNHVVPILRYIPKWIDYSDDKISVNSNYGHAWQFQVYNALDKLRLDIHTRQAIISIYDKAYLQYSGKDTPCTLNIVLSVVNNKFCMTVNMRSNDMFTGMPIDIFCFTALQELLYNTLKLFIPTLELGTYVHNAMSFHMYNQHKFILTAELHDTRKHQHQICDTTTYANFWSAKDAYFFDDTKRTPDYAHFMRFNLHNATHYK
jgi:thymidylate synthase